MMLEPPRPFARSFFGSPRPSTSEAAPPAPEPTTAAPCAAPASEGAPPPRTLPDAWIRACEMASGKPRAADLIPAVTSIIEVPIDMTIAGVFAPAGESRQMLTLAQIEGVKAKIAAGMIPGAGSSVFVTLIGPDGERIDLAGPDKRTSQRRAFMLAEARARRAAQIAERDRVAAERRRFEEAERREDEGRREALKRSIEERRAAVAREREETDRVLCQALRDDAARVAQTGAVLITDPAKPGQT